MEFSSTIKEKWKILIFFSTIISFLLMLLFLINENHQNASLTYLAPPQGKPKVGPITPSMLVVKVALDTPHYNNNNNNNNNVSTMIAHHHHHHHEQHHHDHHHHHDDHGIKASDGSNNNNDDDVDGVKRKCNIFDGKWVYKPKVEPSYGAINCPFVEEKMSCKKNGKPNLEYEKWVWEARDCNIPLLNGRDMVQRFRNKRIVLVGDSLNRNMWESLACILYSSIPNNASSMVQIIHEEISIKTFLKAKGEYNFTVEFFWSPFLVELDKNHESGKKVLVLDKLSPNSKQWLGADIMIFNSGHWWAQMGHKRAWDMFKYKGNLIKDLRLHQAYAHGMKTWANWIQKNVDHTKTIVFFRSISTEHLSPQYNQHCYTKSQPIMDESYKNVYPKNLILVIEKVIKGIKKPQVKYLNITNLSKYRIDAHPSIYRTKDWRILTKNSSNRHAVNNLPIKPDCGHWCLPGVPDTWNRLLYASLYFENSMDKYSSS